MADKSCETCEFGIENACSSRTCRECPMHRPDGCICDDISDYERENCPYYKKYEPTPSKGSE